MSTFNSSSERVRLNSLFWWQRYERTSAELRCCDDDELRQALAAKLAHYDEMLKRAAQYRGGDKSEFQQKEAK